MSRSTPPRLPVFLPPGAPPRFPDPRDAPADGLVAVGGDLAPERLLAAYERGIFPCYGEETPRLWWCPARRAVMRPGSLHVSRRLRRTLHAGTFAWTWNRAFLAVMKGCDENRDGSWILPEMQRAYERLHRLGHAHSLEVWRNGDLCGGLYGVQRGALFAAESMFHRVRDASKVALVVAVDRLFAAGIELFDVQYLTPHLARLGAEEWPRARYLDAVAAAVGRPVDLRAPELATAALPARTP